MGTRLDELGSEVGTSLEKARVARDGASQVRAKLVARQVPRLRAEWRTGRSNLRLGIASSLVVAATIAVTAFFAWPRHDEHPVIESAKKDETKPPLSFVVDGNSGGGAGAFIAASATAETPVTFSDGSELRLAPAARLRVSEVARNGARLSLESGTVHVSVVHRDETHWDLEAGPFAVKVTGTKFDVGWDPASTGLVVRMKEGSVVVRGCGVEDRRLVAGEEFHVACSAPAKAVTTPPESAPAPAPLMRLSRPHEDVGAPTLAPASAAPSASAAPASPKTREPVTLEAAEARGFETTCETLSAQDLLLLADTARYATRFDRATQALEAARRRFAGAEAAATAAFELGRIAMDIRHDLNAAGDHFETYLRERPNGGLAREALGRALEARHRSGDNERAERLAVRYLAAYPDGPHAKLARRLSTP